MPQKVNLVDKLATFSETFAPKTIGYLNDQQISVVKAAGELVWHRHDDTDELFLVVAGSLTVELRDGAVELGVGELLVVPAGLEHRPVAAEEAHVLLVNARGTPNTGDAGGPMTAVAEEI